MHVSCIYHKSTLNSFLNWDFKFSWGLELRRKQRCTAHVFLRTYVKSSTGTINHDKVFLYILCALQHYHNDCFWDFLIKKYSRPIWILGTNEYKMWKNKETLVLSKALIQELYLYFILFLISYSLVHNIGICLEYFMDKNLKISCALHCETTYHTRAIITRSWLETALEY